MDWVGEALRELVDEDSTLWLAAVGDKVAALGGHLELVAVFPDHSLTLLLEPGLNTPGDPPDDACSARRLAPNHPEQTAVPPAPAAPLLPCHRQDDANLAFGATRHRDRIGADQALGGPERRPRSLALGWRRRLSVREPCQFALPEKNLNDGRRRRPTRSFWNRRLGASPSIRQAHRTSRCRRQRGR
jgi:hypothetical protein